jgi:hypothetical protein
LSPVWFFVGAGATVVLAGVTVWSALDEKDTDLCATPGSCSALSSNGTEDRTRTQVLLSATGTLGVATALVGILWTNWKGSPKPGQAALLVSPTSVVLRSSF